MVDPLKNSVGCDRFSLNKFLKLNRLEKCSDFFHFELGVEWYLKLIKNLSEFANEFRTIDADLNTRFI